MVKAVVLGLLLSFSAFADDVIGEYTGTLTLDVTSATPGFPERHDQVACPAGYNISFDGRNFDVNISSVNCGNYGAFNEVMHWVIENGVVFAKKADGSADHERMLGNVANNTISGGRDMNLAPVSFTEKGCEGSARRTLNPTRTYRYAFAQFNNAWRIRRIQDVKAPHYVSKIVTCSDGSQAQYSGYELAHDVYDLDGTVYR
jgi:hypothetical protein